MPNQFYKNIKFLIKSIGKTQKEVFEEIKMSPGSMWQWKNRNPNINTIKRFYEYFTVKNIVIKELNDLLNKDMAQTLLFKNQFLDPGVKYKYPPNKNKPVDQNLTDYEIDLVYKLREIYSSNSTPLPRSTVERLVKFLTLIGIDSNRQQSLIELIEEIHDSPGIQKGNDQPDSLYKK